MMATERPDAGPPTGDCARLGRPHRRPFGLPYAQDGGTRYRSRRRNGGVSGRMGGCDGE
jgi:hypothetical protein